MDGEGQLYRDHGQQPRVLLELFGVSEDDGVYVLIAGMILIFFSFVGCCYCKVYDPLRLWFVKKIKKCCAKGPNKAPPPPPDDAPPERRHWYLNRTLQIDRVDRHELGPHAERKGLQGGWYGARNGGFDA